MSRKKQQSVSKMAFLVMKDFTDRALIEKNSYIKTPQDFSRNRKLNFQTTTTFILSLLTKSLQTELLELMPKNPATKAAFSKARKKINPFFFESLFKIIFQVTEAHLKPKKFNNFRLWACDSTVQVLPNNKDTRLIGIHKNQHKEVASCKLSVYFDVYNQLITNVLIADKRKSDLYLAAENQVQQLPKDVIGIYDRAYPSQLLCFLHQMHGTHFVIRGKENLRKKMSKFSKDTDNECIVTETLDYRCTRKLNEMGIHVDKKNPISYRLVKVPLPTGKIEILMTNLPQKTFSISDLSEIYRLRWSIETSFNVLKNQQMLGTFSGYSQTAVLQDIWANLIFYNLTSLLLLETEKKLAKINKQRQQKYKPNRNISIKIIRDKLPEFIQFKSATKIDKSIRKALSLILLFLEKIKTTNNPRKRKRMRVNDRHHTELNYKRGF